jgi:hypothetical protein
VDSIIEKFNEFNTDNEILENLFTQFPNDLEEDYLVFRLSNSVTEEDAVWNTDYAQAIKRLMMMKFDNWIEKTYMDNMKDG